MFFTTKTTMVNIFVSTLALHSISSWYLAVDGNFCINADLWYPQSRSFQLFVLWFASEVGLCQNWVIEFYITSRNALGWKQLVSYLRFLAFRLWPSFLRSLLLWYFRLSRLIKTGGRSRSRSPSRSTDIRWLFAVLRFRGGGKVLSEVAPLLMKYSS